MYLRILKIQDGMVKKTKTKKLSLGNKVIGLFVRVELYLSDFWLIPCISRFSLTFQARWNIAISKSQTVDSYTKLQRYTHSPMHTLRITIVFLVSALPYFVDDYFFVN